jgi:RNA polymerase sigma-70 factor (ECF subfamily)
MDILDSDNLLERYRPYLTLLARAHLDTRFQRRLDASDVVQQTMLEAHQRLGQFRGSGADTLGGWLRKMLVHNCADAIRAMTREKRDIGREQPLEAAIDQSFSRVESWLAMDQSSPSQQAAKQEELLAMARAVEALPVDQREAVVLHHLQGMSLSDLAGHFGRSESAVAGLLARGLRQLRISLGAVRAATQPNEYAGP